MTASCAMHGETPRCTETSFISWWLVGILLGALGFLLPTFSGRGLEKKCIPGANWNWVKEQADLLEGREGALVGGPGGGAGLGRTGCCGVEAKA